MFTLQVRLPVNLMLFLQHIAIGNCAACSPPSAMRMLEEFVQLTKGDVVLQNGANSAVGQVC